MNLRFFQLVQDVDQAGDLTDGTHARPAGRRAKLTPRMKPSVPMCQLPGIEQAMG